MARRVNTRFLTILTIIVVVISVTALIAHLILGREKPEEFVAAGEQLLAEKKYEEAAKNFERAVQLSQNDPDLWVKWGDALNEASSIDLENMMRARRAWQGALSIDPRHKDALDRSLQYMLAVADMGSGAPEFFQEMHETAKRMHEADPGNAVAEVAVQTSVIRPWLRGVEVDPQRLAETMEAMAKLIEKYPDNADLPFYLAHANLRQAELARERRDMTERSRKIAEAVKIVDEAVARSTSAAMYFSAGQIAGALEGYDAPDKREQWRSRRKEYFAKAREGAKPEDPRFIDIQIMAARSAEPAEGVKILREVAAARPQDQEVRLALADLLKRDPEKRQEAIELLEQPFTREVLRGAEAYRASQLEARTLIMTTDLRMERLGQLDEAEQKKSMGVIQKNLDLLVSRTEKESLPVLRLRGKLLRLQGKNVDAIQTLEKARALAEQMDVTTMERWEIVDILARTYIEMRQTGNARERLTELTNKIPGHDPSRILLASLLLQEGKADEAAPHVKMLVERRPDDPEVMRLQAQLADRRTPGGKPGTDADQAKLRASYARLPEKTRDEGVQKLSVAMTLDDKAEAVRLVNKLQAENPGDIPIVMLAVKVHRALNDIDAARAAVDNALKVRPDDAALQLARKQLADMTPQGLANVALQEAESRKDPFERALIRADAYRLLNKPEEQLQQLQAAVKERPNDGAANRLLFGYHIQHAQWDKAEAVLPTLAAQNADQAGGLLFRYQLAMGKRDYTTALNHARNLVDRLPEFGHTWLALAQVRQAMAVEHQRQGEDATTEFNEALKNFNIALEKQSDNADAMRGAIQCLYDLKRFDDARRRIDEARRIMPSSSVFEEAQLAHEMRFGDPAKVVTAREAQVKAAPENPQKLMALGEAYLALAESQARTANGSGAPATYAKARDTFKRGLTKWPDAIDFYSAYLHTARLSKEPADTEKTLQALAAREPWKERPEPQLLLADFYASQERPAEVEGILRPLLAKFPTPEMTVSFARFLVSQNRLDEALKALEGAGKDHRVVRLQVDILLAQNRLDDAAAVIDKVLAESPDVLPFLQLASIVHMRQGKLDLAGQRLDQAMKLAPDDPITHHYAGQLELSRPQPDFSKAIPHFAKGASNSSALAMESGFALAECHRQLGSYQAQVAALEDVLRKHPNSTRAKLTLADAYLALSPPRNTDAMALVRDLKTSLKGPDAAEALAREARILLAEGKAAEAVASISAAQAARPDDLRLTRQALETLLEARRFADVDQRVAELVAKDKNLWWAYEARAVSKRQQNNREAAIKDFEAALAAADAAQNVPAAQDIILKMGDVIGFNEAINRIQARAEKEDRWKLVLARLQQLGGDNPSAIRTMEDLLTRADQLAPAEQAEALRFAGTAYLVANDSEKATQAYTRLLEVSDRDTTALNNLAYLLTESVSPPRPQEALKYSQRAYDLAMQQGMRDPLVLDTHGWILASAGKVDEGIDVLRRSIEIRATPDAHYHLGESYLRKQFAQEGKRELEKALELINRAKQEKQPVDAVLEQRIVEAIARASVMMSGQEPGGPAGARGLEGAPTAPTASSDAP